MLVPVEARCTFESGFCGWQNTSEEMSLTWKLNKGDRQKFTGPKWDNTFRNRTGNRLKKIKVNMIFLPNINLKSCFVLGTYAYVDMSGPSYLGSAARMESVHFHPPPLYCSDPQSKYYNSCYVSIYNTFIFNEVIFMYGLFYN